MKNRKILYIYLVCLLMACATVKKPELIEHKKPYSIDVSGNFGELYFLKNNKLKLKVYSHNSNRHQTFKGIYTVKNDSILANYVVKYPMYDEMVYSEYVISNKNLKLIFDTAKQGNNRIY